MNAVQPNEVASFRTMDEGVTRMMTVLEEALGEEGAARLCSLLHATGALIAGGSVLGAYQNEVGTSYLRRQDIDIYVPVKHAKAFLDVFVRDEVNSILKSAPITHLRRGEVGKEPILEKSYKSALYCKSFLQKNGIKKVYNFIKGNNSSLWPVEFDVMIVRNRRTPLQVVNNFDLTFCQIWFDGQNMYASHPDDIKQKKGVLQGEYVDLFLQGNQFLKRRIAKYGYRGYKIVLDTQTSGNDIVPLIRSRYYFCQRPEDSILLKFWSSRVLLSWFLNIRDTITSHTENLPPNIRHDNILIVPLKNHSTTREYTGRLDIFGGYSHKTLPIIYNQDDGYDSEDYTENPSLYDIIYNRFLQERTQTDLLKIPAEPTQEIKQCLFHREANKLLEIAMWPNLYNTKNRTLGSLMENPSEAGFGRARLYYDELKARCIRKGTSFITQEDDVEVYDLHEHPLEAGISAEDMEGYLQHHVTDVDKSNVPCYYKPNPADHADPINCKHVISVSEVKYIVSNEFYEKYNAPPPSKLGLDQFMSHYNQTLQNAPSLDPVYGLEYHHSVCPFCIQFESRDTGCSYMVHGNSTHQPQNHAPFCDPRLQIKELFDRYIVVSDRPAELRHLEFCAECGRPCVDHHHISSTPPYTRIEVPMGTLPDGRRGHDYAACTGGGRAELFARILAIRNVYRDGASTNPLEERRLAALAADNAPNDPELMAQGAAIFAQEEATRHWTNAPIPAEKMYNDPAYKSTNSNEETNNNRLEGGKYKHRTTLKKNKHTKKTRKH